MSRFLTTLRSGRVLLMDGAMGTELQRAGLGNEQAELWNLTQPQRVLAIHQAYAEAGAEVLLTNTFQVVHASIAWESRSPLPPHRLDESRALIALQWAAAALARCACRPGGFVLADIGCYVSESDGQEFSDLSLLVDAVKGVGPVDGILLETCSTPRALLAAKKAIRARGGDLPVLLSLTFKHGASGYETISGHPPEWFAERAAAAGIAALGVNCGREVNMEGMSQIVRAYRSATDLPLFARPNAGTPTRRDGRLLYPRTAPGMAVRLGQLLEAGVSMVGGCCGTTPRHIAALRPIVARWNARRRREQGSK